MPRKDFNNLLAFLAVARERSFTRAAAKLGVSQSALSHNIRGLEERTGLRLFTRTTRSVSPTEAGERLLRTVGPRFEEIETELAALSELRDKPAGTIRITTTEHAAYTILWLPFCTICPISQWCEATGARQISKRTLERLRGDVATMVQTSQLNLDFSCQACHSRNHHKLP